MARTDQTPGYGASLPPMPDGHTEMFWSRVEDTGFCWFWLGHLSNQSRYGMFSIRGREFAAHRVAYHLLIGQIPPGMQLDHLCRIRHCVNPDHLEPVTRQENIRRGMSSAGLRARQARCIHGHEFNDENTIVEKNGRRVCRPCRSRRRAEGRQRRLLAASSQ